MLSPFSKFALTVLIGSWGGTSIVAQTFPMLTHQPSTNQQSTADDKNETPQTVEKKEIKRILTRQAAAWNAGDLEKFMQTYWKSDELTFSGGGKTTRGWQATLDRYRDRYAPPNEMGQLKFDHVEITLIENNAALVLGQWHLTMKQGENLDGNFTLVIRKIASNWKIIHDHSSTLEAKESPAN